MFKKTRVCKGLMLAFGSGLALGVLPAAAQTTETAQLDRVEITGSSIKRLAAEQSLPVTVLKADELAKVGVTNAEQALAFVTSNQSGTVSGNSVGGSNGGASFANLRGLGDSRTLVLVNGKRMVNNPYTAATVDLNALPFGAVERVEVLTDGASAIYGSDAIAGVVNFITRKEFTGVNLMADGSWPTESGGGQVYNVGITAGVGSLSEQGWNVFGGVTYRKQDALKATDRDFSKTSFLPEKGFDKTSGTTFPANYNQAGVPGSFNPSAPACDPPNSIARSPTATTCRFDYVTFVDIVPQQEQLSLIGKASYAVNADNTVSLEYIQARNTLNTVIAPPPLTGLSMPSTNPYYPGMGTTPANPALDPANPIGLGWRTTVTGGRSSEFVNNTNRILLNWEGQYKGWDYSATAFQSKAKVDNTFTGGYLNLDKIQDGLNGANGAPFLNPFGDQTAAGLAYMQASKILGQVQNSEGTLRDFTAQTSGSIYQLPAGPMMLAVGVEFMHDETSYLNNFALIRQASSSGLELAQDSSGSRRDGAIMAELNIPVLKELELNLALRYDNYSDVGSTTNPKVSFRWQPTQALLFRGSYNTGFRAPTLQDLYSPLQLTNTGNVYDDPVLCPGGVVNTAAGGVETRDCGQQFNQRIGGNAKLVPETSKAWTIGIAAQPVESVTLGLDYWNYKVEHSIGPTGETVIFGDPTKYSSRFVRCSQLSASEAAVIPGGYCDPALGGDGLAYIDNGQLNLGNYKTDGIDVTGTWQSVATDFGRFNVGYRGTYVMSYEYQLDQGEPYNNNLGVYFNGQPIARYRQVINFGWQYGAWSTQLVNRYTSAYQDENTDANDMVRTVAGNNTWDLAVTWTGVKGLAVTAGLTNMFNKQPPYTNQSDFFQVGYDFRYANPIGRAFLLRGTYQF